MRHRVTGRKLGRTASHRRTTLAALSMSLIEHKRIRTTVAKAKATQQAIEPIITRAKYAYEKESNGEAKDIHARREVAKLIKKPAIVRELFDQVAPKVVDRNGGYTRVVKLGQRDGDGAHMAIIELVDFSEATTRKSKAKKKTEKAAAASAKQQRAKKAEDEAVTADEQTKDAATATEEKADTETKPSEKQGKKSEAAPDNASDDAKEEAKDGSGEKKK